MRRQLVPAAAAQQQAQQQQRQQQQEAMADRAATSSGNEFGEVAKQLHSAVQHAHPPGSPTAHSSPGAGNQQPFVAGMDPAMPFRWVVVLGAGAACRFGSGRWLQRPPVCACTSLQAHCSVPT